MLQLWFTNFDNLELYPVSETTLTLIEPGKEGAFTVPESYIVTGIGERIRQQLLSA